MRHELASAIFAGILALSAAAHAAASPRACAQPANMNGNHVKPSSLAPREPAYRNAYGAPVGKPILSRHAPHKAKPQPQLHTSPLPGA